MYSKVTLFSQDTIDCFVKLIKDASRVAIVCHMTPDGDALGSSLCLCHTLRNMGLRADVVTPDQPPRTLSFLPGAREITVASYQQERARRILDAANVVFCLDFNDLKRIDRLAPMVDATNAKRIVIDHHLNPSIEADLLVSHPEKSSTCLLLYMILEAAGFAEFINTDAATCCCAGIMTDTGNCAYNANDPDLYIVLGNLMKLGVDKNALYDRLFNSNTLSRLRIMGYCQYERMHLLEKHHCALITLSLDEAREFGYNKGDTEGLVNIPLSIPGVVYSIYLRQDEENYVKVSMRSKGDFSVKELCEQHFGGGGHHNAAGGELHCSLTEAVSRVLALVEEVSATTDF